MQRSTDLRQFGRPVSFQIGSGAPPFQEFFAQGPTLFLFTLLTPLASVQTTYNVKVLAVPRECSGLVGESGIQNRRAYLYLPFGGNWLLFFSVAGSVATPVNINGFVVDGITPEVYLATMEGPPSETATRSITGPGNFRLTDSLNVRALRSLVTAGTPGLRVGTTANPNFPLPASPAIFDTPSDLLAMQSIIFTGAAGYTVANLYSLD